MLTGDVIPLDFDHGLVALSYLVSVLGSFVAIECAMRVTLPSARIRWLNIVAAAFALGGVAIWGTHFVGMTADKMPIDVQYDIGLTLVSLVAAITGAAGAIWYVGRAPADWRHAALGGAFAGLGIVVMFYTGMAALHAQADIRWNGWLVAAAVGIAVTATTAALWLAFHLRTVWRRMLAALIMGVAVSATHHVGLIAGTLVYHRDATENTATLLLAGDALPFYVFFVAVAILGITYVTSLLGSPDYRVAQTRPASF